MSRPKPLSGNPKAWVPLRPAVRVPMSEQHLAGLLGEFRARGFNDIEALAAIDKIRSEAAEMWMNDHVVITVRRHADGWVEQIHVRRQDRKPLRDWRVLQRIKNEIAGDEVEAVELYPAESRLMDTANSYWLWCMPPGLRFPFGFEGRNVGEDGAAACGVPQRPL